MSSYTHESAFTLGCYNIENSHTAPQTHSYIWQGSTPRISDGAMATNMGQTKTVSGILHLKLKCLCSKTVQQNLPTEC